MCRLEHEISVHLHDIGAPVKLLHLVLEKIAAGEGIAVGFHIALATVTRDRRVAPAEFPSGMLGTQAPAFEPHRKRIRIERIQCRHAVYDNQSMNVELQLHLQFVAKAVDEISGIRSTAHMADLHPGAHDIAELHLSRLGLKARQLVFDRLQRLDHLPGKEELGLLLRLGNRQHFAATPSGQKQFFMQTQCQKPSWQGACVACRYACKLLAGFVGSHGERRCRPFNLYRYHLLTGAFIAVAATAFGGRHRDEDRRYQSRESRRRPEPLELFNPFPAVTLRRRGASVLGNRAQSGFSGPRHPTP